MEVLDGRVGHPDEQRDVDRDDVALLEDAPGLIRPMIVHGTKKGATAKQQAHMAPVYAGEAQWKKVVGYASSDDAYLLVADAQSKVVWLGHGVFSEEKYGALKRAVDGLKGKAK